MKRVLSMALCAAAAAALMTGCEWSSSSDHNETWNDSYNWVNFSGTYRSVAGGMLVTDYTTTPSTPGATNNYSATESGGWMDAGATTRSGTTKNKPIIPGSFSVVVGEVTLADDGTGTLSGNGGSGTVSYAGGTWSIKVDSGSSSETATASESAGYLDAGALSKSGTAGHKSIVPRSFTITVGDVTMSDDGDGNLTGSGVKSGSVSYDGGGWSFTLSDKYSSTSPRRVSVAYSYRISVVDGKREVIVRYGYSVSNSGGSGGSAQAGSTGKPIYSFVVSQQGQNLTITDNNGAKYTGRISGMRSASGIGPTNSLPRDGDTIVASFSTKGTSAAGKQVTITGTFQGTVSASVFTGRTMQATWVESGGKTGDVNGTTGAVAIPASAAATTPSTSTSTTTDSSSSSTSGSTTTAQ